MFAPGAKDDAGGRLPCGLNMRPHTGSADKATAGKACRWPVSLLQRASIFAKRDIEP